MDSTAQLALAGYNPPTERTCDNPRCRRLFMPRIPWQRYCRSLCRREVQRAMEHHARRLYLEWAAAQGQGQAEQIAVEMAEAIPPRRWPGQDSEQGSGHGRLRSTVPMVAQQFDGFARKRETQERFGVIDGRPDVRAPVGLGRPTLRDRRR